LPDPVSPVISTSLRGRATRAIWARTAWMAALCPMSIRSVIEAGRAARRQRTPGTTMLLDATAGQYPRPSK